MFAIEAYACYRGVYYYKYFAELYRSSFHSAVFFAYLYNFLGLKRGYSENFANENLKFAPMICE